MSQSTVNLYIRLFSQALNGLGARTDMATIERLSLLVHRSMEQPRRVYHNSEHVFKLIDGMNPHQTLAGLFHDVVYVQLDDGFAPWAADWLVPVVAKTKKPEPAGPREPSCPNGWPLRPRRRRRGGRADHAAGRLRLDLRGRYAVA